MITIVSNNNARNCNCHCNSRFATRGNRLQAILMTPKQVDRDGGGGDDDDVQLTPKRSFQRRFLRFQSLLLLVLLVSRCYAVAGMCPMRCTCHERRLVVDCKQAGLDVVPITLNPELKELYLTGNQIRSIAASFSFYASLEFLELSGNQLPALGRRNFHAQRWLRALFLNNNRLSELSEQTFIGLGSLQLLNLRENALQRLPPFAFADLAKLERLDLSRNQLTALTAHCFDGLSNLKALQLRGNHIVRIAGDALRPLVNLVKLDLGQNALGAPSPPANTNSNSNLGSSNMAATADDETGSDNLAALAAVKTLDELSLDGNQLVQLDPTVRWLGNLTQLRKLHLHQNRLQRVPSPALARLTILHELRLDGNQLTIIEPRAFVRLSKLRQLHLGRNRLLTSLHSDAFVGLGDLIELHLDLCPQLSPLPDQIFADARRTLRRANLRGSQLTDSAGNIASSSFTSSSSSASSIPSQSLLDWDAIEFIDWRDNRVHCDCSLLWLWQTLKRRHNLSTAVPSSSSLSSSLRASSSLSTAAAGGHHRLTAVGNSRPLHLGSSAGQSYQETLICTQPTNLAGLSLRSLAMADLACYDAAGRRSLLTASLLIALVSASVSIVFSLWCRQRFFHYLKMKGKYDARECKEPLDYFEKGRIIDNHLIFPSSTMVLLQSSPIKSNTGVSQV